MLLMDSAPSSYSVMAYGPNTAPLPDWGELNVDDRAGAKARLKTSDPN